MAFRSLNILFFLVLLLGLFSAPAQACFGPKLFVAAGDSVLEETLYALVTLYIEEKTGVESVRVAIDNTQTPLALVTAEKADLVFVPGAEASAHIVFTLEKELSLVAGKRPLEELQFTTVLPAVEKLQRLLMPEDIVVLVEQVKAGEGALAVARKFLMKRRWI